MVVTNQVRPCRRCPAPAYLPVCTRLPLPACESRGSQQCVQEGCGAHGPCARAHRLAALFATYHLLIAPFLAWPFQVVSDPGGGSMFVADPKKAVGGHVVSTSATKSNFAMLS